MDGTTQTTETSIEVEAQNVITNALNGFGSAKAEEFEAVGASEDAVQADDVDAKKEQAQSSDDAQEGELEGEKKSGRAQERIQELSRKVREIEQLKNDEIALLRQQLEQKEQKPEVAPQIEDEPEPELDTLDEESVKAWYAWKARRDIKEALGPLNDLQKQVQAQNERLNKILATDTQRRVANFDADLVDDFKEVFPEVLENGKLQEIFNDHLKARILSQYNEAELFANIGGDNESFNEEVKALMLEEAKSFRKLIVSPTAKVVYESSAKKPVTELPTNRVVSDQKPKTADEFIFSHLSKQQKG